MILPLGRENPVTIVDVADEPGEGGPALLSDQLDNEDTEPEAPPVADTVRSSRYDNERRERLAALVTVPEDERAFDQFITDVTPMLKRLIGRFGINPNDYDDCLNEIYLRLWLGRTKFTKGPGTIVSWSYRVARNYLVDQTRSRKLAPNTVSMHALQEAVGFDPPAQVNIEYEVLTSNALRRVLTTALQRGETPQETLTMLLLASTEELPRAELAKQFGLSAEAMRAAIFRTRAHLRHVFGKKVDDWL